MLASTSCSPTRRCSIGYRSRQTVLQPCLARAEMHDDGGKTHHQLSPLHHQSGSHAGSVESLSLVYNLGHQRASLKFHVSFRIRIDGYTEAHKQYPSVFSTARQWHGDP